MNATVTARSIRRLIATSIMAALAALASASPTVAGGSTLWVDDDGLAGAQGCGSTESGYSTVQAAIDASAPHDTILVCPGTYQEELLIDGSHDGLAIRSARAIRALILMPPAMTTRALITIIGVDDVSLERLDLRTLAAPPCPSIAAMVAVRGGSQGIALRQLSIAPGGTDTMGPCAIERGIKASGGSSVEVTDNTIRDFLRGGITLRGTQTSGTILRNSIQFLHATVAYTGSNEGGHGITVDRAHATVRENRVDAGPAAGPGGTPDLNAGISLSGTDLVAKRNRIRHVRFGITIWSDGVSVRQNDLKDGTFGVWVIGAEGGVIASNRVRGYAYGTLVEDPSAGNLFRGNDLHGNASFDCYDVSNGTGTAGTANTWIDNIGLVDEKDGICSPPTP